MFSDKADFSSMLAEKEKVSVSQAQHKAFIEVNESGTEAAAATCECKVLLYELKIFTKSMYFYLFPHFNCRFENCTVISYICTTNISVRRRSSIRICN